MSVYLWGELPIGRESKYWLYTSPQAESTIMDLVIGEIPSSASVSVSNNIGAHLSHREFFYNFPIATQSAEYILVKADDPNAWPSLGDQKRGVEELMIDPTYELLIQSGSFTAFRKR